MRQQNELKHIRDIIYSPSMREIADIVRQLKLALT